MVTVRPTVIGDTYETRGGWRAKIVWICQNDLQHGFYAVHKPSTEEESAPIYHFSNGTAHGVFSVNEPPRYDKPHPADIVFEK